MFLKFAFLLTILIGTPSLGLYNPRGFFFKIQTAHPRNDKNIAGSLKIMMHNPPLYFSERNNNRNYIQRIECTILKNINETYDLSYTIQSPRKNESLSLKEMSPEKINEALQYTFPDFPSAYVSKVTEKIPSLFALKESKENKALFSNTVTLINKLLPASIIHFDEQDLLTAVPTFSEMTGWRAWFRSWFDIDVMFPLHKF